MTNKHCEKRIFFLSPEFFSGDNKTGDRTRNLRGHILEYFPTKHAAAKANLL